MPSPSPKICAGAAHLFNHLSSIAPVRATLSDLNADLMGVFRLVRDAPEFFLGETRGIEARWLALSVGGRKSLYYDLRSEYWEMPDGPAATVRLYFLMKTAFNGIWQTCKASQGRFATPAGLANQRTRVIDPDVVFAWSAKLARAQLVDGPYSDVDVPHGSFVFCDPPYRDSFTSYGTAFDNDAQADLIDWCRKMHRDRDAIV